MYFTQLPNFSLRKVIYFVETVKLINKFFDSISFKRLIGNWRFTFNICMKYFIKKTIDCTGRILDFGSSKFFKRVTLIFDLEKKPIPFRLILNLNSFSGGGAP